MVTSSAYIRDVKLIITHNDDLSGCIFLMALLVPTRRDPFPLIILMSHEYWVVHGRSDIIFTENRLMDHSVCRDLFNTKTVRTVKVPTPFLPRNILLD